MAGPSDVVWYYTNMFYDKAQSAVGVVSEWVLVYAYRMKCSLAVVTCRDCTSQTFSTGDSVDEGEGDAFHATGNSMIAERVGLKMASHFPMFGENSQGHFKGNAWI
jgi:hypothetical protein